MFILQERKPVANLTQKQEKFAQAYVNSGNASEAYRLSYDTKAKPESIHVSAHEVLNRPNVALRIKELQDELEEKNLWSRLDSIKTLISVIREDEESKPNDKVNAVKVINSMHGWDKQVIEQTTTHSMDATLAERLTGGSKR